MKSVTEILTALYDEDTWHERESDEDNAGCKFCLAAEDRDGVVHHYADCLLREIRAHLMAQATRNRRLYEACVEYGVLTKAYPLPEPIYLGNNPSGSTVVLPPEESSLAEEIKRIVAEEITAEPKVPEVVPEAEVYRTARAEPETIPEVKPELLHSWQATGDVGAVYCVNCNLVSLAGVPTGILAGGVCPGTNPAPAEVKAVQPAVPLVQVMCPRCGARETVPATGGAFPDLPQITMEGPFTVASWTHPAFGRQTGVYCRKCWFDVVASLVAAILPPAVICHPAQTGGPGKLA